MLRFAILKTLAGTDTEVLVLEYDNAQILSNLQAKIRERLIKTETWRKHSWSKNEISQAVNETWADLIKEFKAATIKLP